MIADRYRNDTMWRVPLEISIMKRPFWIWAIVVLAVFLSVRATMAIGPVEVVSTGLPWCESIGHFEGSSGYGKNPGWRSIADTYAIQRAARAGATHVHVLKYLERGSFNGEVVMEAYRCQNNLPQRLAGSENSEVKTQ